ncbi:MAG: alpha/beta hydrolase [Tumebacillaceae bacterium]
MEQWFNIRGTRLHVEIAGPEDAPPVLFLHGGPGGQGAYEYMHFQRERLGSQMRLIALDQRGTLRSDALGEEEPLLLQDLIDDIEALRETLGLAHWTVLGHSFGGYLATRYALAHGNRLDCLVLEAPSFDLGLTFRSNLRKAAGLFANAGHGELRDACLALAASDLPTAELAQAQNEPLSQLGELWAEMFIHGADKDITNRVMAEAPFEKELLSRAGQQSKKLYAEGRLFESLLGHLDQIHVPTLLVRGASDPILSDDQVQAFQEKVPHGQIVVFANSGHVPYAEEADRYAETVTTFITQHAN